MKATAFEFRHRFWISMAIYALGFTAPWDAALPVNGAGANAHLWGVLAVLLSKTGMMSIGCAFNVVLGVGIVCAGAGAWLRTWGSAYLGTDVMRDSTMRGEGVVADGPYRHVRNPLYLGSWIHSLALALLMPVSGAIFALVLLALFQMRLILGEESFLSGKRGESYAAYCARVPRLLPALRPQIAASGARARWARAALAEIFMWGMTASFAVLGWQYNAFLLMKCVLVWLGLSMVVRALQMQDQPAA
ncbi:MAG TPA: isoprenylcysteine carboxylmethyltransferase family protein [Acidobacteriaceae bacterium]|jgi:protein-S-isoprenylcysteine O-methyltransferase Ste14|nr:isoprenylcysteine carboxylmethyltransferase family protein [Acidobacteriaceae bacterium]